jgi:TPR repeat protein
MIYSPDRITEILSGSNDEDIASVIKYIKKEADKGDARANYMLAKWHRDGSFGFKKSKKDFIRFLKIAMDKMLPEAIYDYGVSVDGKSEDRSKKAMGYYVLASILGDADAMDALINYYVYGIVVEKDNFLASSIKMHKDNYA